MKERIGIFNTSRGTALVAFCSQNGIQPSANRVVIIDDQYSERLIHTHLRPDPRANGILFPLSCTT
jgi:hypothetical protein